MKIRVEVVNINVSVDIDLDTMKSYTGKQLLCNEDFIEYVKRQIGAVSLSDAIFTNLETMENGNKGFLAIQLEIYNNLSK